MIPPAVLIPDTLDDKIDTHPHHDDGPGFIQEPALDPSGVSAL
jgi:hypothetical protein